MSSSEIPNKPGSYTVGLSTARFLDQAMLDDVASEVTAPSTPQPPAPDASPTSSRVESDQEVNSYMQHLLQRSSQLAPEPSCSATSAPQTNVNFASSSETAPLVDQSSSQEQELEEAWTTDLYMPKKTAPEREADLKAFRKLANASARGALNSFQQKVHRKKSRVSGIVAICSLVASFPLYLLSNQWGDNWSLCFLGALALTASSTWSFYKSGQSAQMKH